MENESPNNQKIMSFAGNWHWGYLYKKYPGSYYYPHWQQTYYNVKVGQYGYQHGGQYLQQGVYQEGTYQQGGKYPGVQQGSQYQGEGKLTTGATGYSQEAYKGKLPYAYQQVGEHPVTGATYQQTVYKQGSYQGKEAVTGYYGSGRYPAQGGSYYGSYPTGTYKGNEEYLRNYYQNKYIGDIVGGALSLDGKPLGYPFDRQLAHSAFYAQNIYIKDVVVLHEEEYIPEY